MTVHWKYSVRKHTHERGVTMKSNTEICKQQRCLKEVKVS